MASSRVSFSDDLRMINRTLPKSALLRDYLLDDMSSCSSNGFRSFPRRQCCTTAVRFLIETDLNKNAKKLRSNHKPKQSSVLQKASELMINAFKHLRFASSGAGLSRSLSRKLLKHGFWKKTDQRNNEVKRLTSFADLLKEKDISPPPSPSPVSTAVATAVTSELTSSTSNSNSWSGSEFTAGTENFNNAGNNSEVILTQNVVADKLMEKKMTNGKGVDTTTTVTNYSDSTENETQKKWQDKHEEQFSPISVMDFPTDNDNDNDDEDEVSSLSQHKHLGVKGIKISTHKTRVFEGVCQLEPVKLEDRIAQSILESSTITLKENQIEKNALALFQLMKSTVSSCHSLEFEVLESVLLGFFNEIALKENVSDYEILQRAKDWMDGQEQEVFIDWETKNNRDTYLRDIEKGVKWSNYDHEFEKVNVGFEVECEMFNSLVNDVLTELLDSHVFYIYGSKLTNRF